MHKERERSLILISSICIVPCICYHSLQNLETSCNPVVNKPKPKVEPPKDEDKEKAAEEEKMEDDSKKDGEESEGTATTTQPPAIDEMDVD